MKKNHDLLLEKHNELDFLCRNSGNRIFISDWYCKHPFVRKYLPVSTFNNTTDKDLLYYCFQNDTNDIREEIKKFHKNNDGLTYKNEEIFIGAGMTPLITAQMLMLKTMKVKEIYYAKPLYYTFYYLSKLFNIKLNPICEIPLNKSGISLILPDKKTILIICDPLWYMGRNIMSEYIEKIKEWQERTESYILVDGAFQYMKWDTNDRKENTSIFNKELTFRSICPTKALAIHGIRFSYTLLPKKHKEDMRYAYSNSSGSACIFSQSAAKRIMQVLNTKVSNFELLNYIQEKYEYFLSRQVFKDDIGAQATYFIFVKMLGNNKKYIAMDQDFFDTSNYPGYSRFNLLLPHKL